MGGLELLKWLMRKGHRPPAIMISGGGDVPMAVQAMKAGAVDFIEKPVRHEELRAGIERAWNRRGIHPACRRGGRWQRCVLQA